MNRTITCDYSDNLIEKIADHAFDNFISKGIEPSRLCFVFGGKRPALFLKKALSKRAGKSMLSPSFFTMEEFVKETAALGEPVSLMPDIESAYLIYSLSKKLAPKMLGVRDSFAEFLPWAYELLSFINQADMEEVSEEALLNIEANAGIGYDIPENINEMLRSINILRKAFHREVETKKIFTRGLLYKAAAKHAGEYNLNKYEAVIFGNLFFLHKTEEKAVKAVFDQGKGVLFFQGNSAEWPVLKGLEKTFSCEIASKRENEPEIRLYCGHDKHSQASIAKKVISSLDEPDKSVLILPDPEMLMPVITDISSAAENLNVSLGYPIEKSSLFSLLEAIFKAQGSRKAGQYYAKDYLGVMLHPLAKNLRLPFDPAVTRQLTHKVEEALTSDSASGLCGSLYIDISEVSDEKRIYSLSEEPGLGISKADIKGVFEELHKYLFKIWENPGTFEGLAGAAAVFAEKIAEKSFARYYPLNSKTIMALLEISDELQKTSFGTEKFPKEDLLKILLERLRAEYLSFPGSPLKGFQVLGLLESRSLNFENVIVVDVNESILPKLKVSEPLIPSEVMLALGISRVEKEEEIQRYEFFRLIKGAKGVHLIYSRDDEKERSRFIEELIWERQKKDKTYKLGTASFGFRAEASRGKLVYAKPPEVLEFLKAMRYSASKVNTYINCPLRFYFEHVLGIKELDKYSDEPDGSEIGTFIHGFLFESYKPFVGKKPIFDAKYEADYLKKLEESFDGKFSKRMSSGAFLVKEVVMHRMKRLIENERNRNPKRIIALEQSYSSSYAAGGRNYDFKARIDRIDELEDGSILIIDYKTGGAGADRMKAKLPDGLVFSRETVKKYIVSFQLPVYINLVGKEIKGSVIDAALYDLRSCELAGFYKGDDLGERKQRLSFCEQALEYIIKEINDPEKPFAADDDTAGRCAVCPYSYMCR